MPNGERIVKENKGFTLIELMVVVAIIAILAGLAIPTYLNFMAKSRQSEVKTNLEGIYRAEISWYGEKSSYDNNFTTIGWRPEGNSHYTFSVGSDYSGKTLAANPMPSVAAPFASDNAFVAYGWANIDTDATIDVWHIDHQKKLDPDRDDLSS
jgi:prepilin-type N-terminal cleavage/methylation domain-containing protein